jgi:hypothetical protein
VNHSRGEIRHKAAEIVLILFEDDDAANHAALQIAIRAINNNPVKIPDTAAAIVQLKP